MRLYSERVVVFDKDFAELNPGLELLMVEHARSIIGLRISLSLSLSYLSVSYSIPSLLPLFLILHSI